VVRLAAVPAVLSSLIATPRARIFSDQYLGGMRAKKDGTLFHEFEEIVFENCLPHLPTLGGMNHEHFR
jgi:hypothetical protein